MKFIKKIIYIIVTCLVCAGCVTKQGEDISRFKDIVYTPRYAKGFEIMADEGGNMLLRVTQPWQGIAPQPQTLAIFKDGVAANYTGEHTLRHPQRIVCMSSSHIAMLDALGLSSTIVAVSGKRYVMTEGVADNPEVADIGYDSNLDYERLITLRPDLVLMYGVSAEDTSVTSRLRTMGIPYIYLGDYTEQSPLGKAEWLVAVAHIMGQGERGVEIFNAIAERYNAIKQSVTPYDIHPTVMLNTPYQDIWYMPSDRSYIVQLIEDAGGAYIYKGKNTTEASCAISIEEALNLVGRADIWLNVGQCTTLDELRTAAPLFAEMEVVTQGHVYNNNRRRTAAGGSDFWESAIVNPDIVLNDMVRIMQLKSDSLYYHHKLN